MASNFYTYVCIYAYLYLLTCLTSVSYFSLPCPLPPSLPPKDAGRNSITHNATVITNGIMHHGTTCDVFLRENLEWLKRASNWGKFTAIASLGTIHYVRGHRLWFGIGALCVFWARSQGHEKEALNLMSSYLPDDNSGSPYSEGGALYALGKGRGIFSKLNNLNFSRSNLYQSRSENNGISL